jgi:cation/acetate symporter
VSHDLVKGVINPKISDKKELLIARFAAGGAVILAGYFGVNPPGFVAQTVAFAFGLAAASFFPAILMGIFSKRMNAEGAISGMIAGLLFTGGYIAWFTYLSPESNNPDGWFLGISPEGIGTVGMLVNMGVAMAISSVTPAPEKEIQDMVERIRVPR